MILNLAYTSKYLYVFNQVKSRSKHLLFSLSVLSLYFKSFYHLVIFFDFP